MIDLFGIVRKKETHSLNLGSILAKIFIEMNNYK